MSKKFTYCKMTNRGEVEFDYEVEDSVLLDEIVELINDVYFGNKANKRDLRSFIIDFDLLDYLVETYEDDLYEIFKKEAFDNE